MDRDKIIEAALPVDDLRKAVLPNDDAPKAKRKRGRPKKIDPEQEKKIKLEHWESVAAVCLKSLSSIIDTKFPGCGPKDQEINAAKGSVSWLLDHYFPEDSDLSVHWSNIVLALVVPTGMRVMQKKGLQSGAHTANGQVNIDKKREEKEAS